MTSLAFVTFSKLLQSFHFHLTKSVSVIFFFIQNSNQSTQKLNLKNTISFLIKMSDTLRLIFPEWQGACTPIVSKKVPELDYE